jgi:hypothetical protein
MALKTYDRASYFCAKQFLQDHPELDSELNRNDLAAAIQQAVEDWIKEATNGPR